MSDDITGDMMRKITLLQSRLALSEAREAACVEALADMTDVLRRIQDTLSRHVDPGGDLQDPMETVNAVLFIADHRDTLARQRAALKALSTLSPAAAGLLKIKEAASDYCDGQMLEGIKALTLVEALCEYDALAALTRTESR